MIETPTVLVLGAGASKPYGFPSGRELLLEVSGETPALSNLSVQLQGYGFGAQLVQNFQHELGDSRLPSIDAFLENRPEYVEVGKHAIALSLIPREDPNLLRHGSEERWYEYLFGKLSGPREHFWWNNLSIVTFNYDRSLESFLFAALKATYGIDSPTAVKFMQLIPIMHVYGELGPFDFDGKAGRPYTNEVTEDAVGKAVHAIQVMPEDSPSEGLKRAHVRLSGAKIVCFLGFGYHPTNVQRLELHRFRGSLLLGSAFGLEPREIQQAAQLLNLEMRRGLSKEELVGFLGEVHLGRTDEDVLAFLRRYPVFG